MILRNNYIDTTIIKVSRNDKEIIINLLISFYIKLKVNKRNNIIEQFLEKKKIKKIILG